MRIQYLQEHEVRDKIDELNEELDEYQAELDDALAAACDTPDEVEGVQDEIAELEYQIQRLGREIDALEDIFNMLRYDGPAVNENDFRDYVQEHVLENSSVPEYLECYIDWGQMADDWRPDYNEIEFGGKTWLIRA